MPEYRIVSELPHLVTEEEYENPATDSSIRIRITIGEDGIEVCGDSPMPVRLEALLAALDPEYIDKTLCG